MPRSTREETIRIGLCADDYGLTPGVSRAIRELLAGGRISATSVMAACEDWPGEAAALKPFADTVDIGLHITLTDQQALARMPTFAPDGVFPPLPAVLKAALLRRLPLGEIEAEIERQLAAFVAHFGEPPAHLDGHHHIHQLPGIREIVVGLARRLAPSGTYVRRCVEPVRAIVGRGVGRNKALLISGLGLGLARRIQQAGLASNHGFSGAYDFGTETRPFGDLCGLFLRGARSGHLVMCHPAYADADLAAKDTMTTARDAERAFLASDAWPRLLADAGFSIGPLRVRPGPL